MNYQTNQIGDMNGLNISDMGGGTPIAVLRKDIVDKQARQINIFLKIHRL